MNSLEKLYEQIENLHEVKRLNELEKIIDSKQELKEKFEDLLSFQKQMINSKHLGLKNAYIQQKNEYEKYKEQLLSFVFVEEYLELLDETYVLIKNIVSIIENQIELDFL